MRGRVRETRPAVPRRNRFYLAPSRRRRARARDAWESDAVVVVSATPPEGADARVDARFHERLTRLFWARCPDAMAATTRATAECLSPK